MGIDFPGHLAVPLIQLEEGLKNVLRSKEEFMQKVNEHLLLAQGKRFRPVLFFLGLGIWDENPENHLDVAVAIELIHAATLLHDDVIDKSEQRRGLPTVNAKWGNHVSVLAGDYLFAKAFGLLTAYGNLALIREIASLVEQMSEGEIQQHTESFRVDLGYDSYIDRVTRKTARFFSACMRGAGIVSGVNQELLPVLHEYGLNIGIGFQIIDDLLDFCGDPLATGKKPGGDLLQGIITLPVLHILDQSAQGLQIARRIKQKEIDPSLVELICGEMKDCKTEDYIRATAAEYVENAQHALQKLPCCVSRDALRDMAQVILVRNC